MFHSAVLIYVVTQVLLSFLDFAAVLRTFEMLLSSFAVVFKSMFTESDEYIVSVDLIGTVKV